MTEELYKMKTIPAADGWDVLSFELDEEAVNLTGPFREPLIAWAVAEEDQSPTELGVTVGKAIPITPSVRNRRIWIFALQQRVNIGQGMVRVWSRKLRGVEIDEAEFLERAWVILNEEWSEVYGETLEETMRRESRAGGAKSSAAKEKVPA